MIQYFDLVWIKFLAYSVMQKGYLGAILQIKWMNPVS